MKPLNKERFVLTIKHRSYQYVKIFNNPLDLLQYIERKYGIKNTNGK